MIQATLTQNMRNILANMKGDSLQNIEGCFWFGKEYGNTFGNLRFYLAHKAIDLTNYQKVFTVFGDEEEISSFECMVVEVKSEFVCKFL